MDKKKSFIDNSHIGEPLGATPHNKIAHAKTVLMLQSKRLFLCGELMMNFMVWSHFVSLSLSLEVCALLWRAFWSSDLPKSRDDPEYLSKISGNLMETPGMETNWLCDH